MNNALRIIALLVAFGSGVFAHSFYFKPSKDFVKLESTRSGQFIIKEGRIYSLEELEIALKEPIIPAYSDGASQSYHLPTGRK